MPTPMPKVPVSRCCEKKATYPNSLRALFVMGWFFLGCAASDEQDVFDTAKPDIGGDAAPDLDATTFLTWDVDPTLPRVIKIIEPELPRVFYTDTDKVSIRFTVWADNLRPGDIVAYTRTPDPPPPDIPSSGGTFISFANYDYWPVTEFWATSSRHIYSATIELSMVKDPVLVAYIVSGDQKRVPTRAQGFYDIDSPWFFDVWYEDSVRIFIGKKSCSTAADCDDRRRCTWDVCDNEGQCRYFPHLDKGICSWLWQDGGYDPLIDHFGSMERCADDVSCREMYDGSIDWGAQPFICGLFGCHGPTQRCAVLAPPFWSECSYPNVLQCPGYL